MTDARWQTRLLAVVAAILVVFGLAAVYGASSLLTVAAGQVGSRKISATSGARTMMNGNIPCWKVRMRSPFFAASIAVQSTTANLASSDGCTVTNPRFTQRRAPLIVGVMRWVNGRRGRRSNTAAMASTGQAARCHLR